MRSGPAVSPTRSGWVDRADHLIWLFLRRLDDLHTWYGVNKSVPASKELIARRAFRRCSDIGKDGGRPFTKIQAVRRVGLHLAPSRDVLPSSAIHVFPYACRPSEGDLSTYAHRLMKRPARFDTIFCTRHCWPRSADCLRQRSNGGPRHQGRSLRICVGKIGDRRSRNGSRRVADGTRSTELHAQIRRARSPRQQPHAFAVQWIPAAFRYACQAVSRRTARGGLDAPVTVAGNVAWRYFMSAWSTSPVTASSLCAIRSERDRRP